MSDSPLLNKMDALLKKHRGSSEVDANTAPSRAANPAHTPPPGAWLPVLTDVIERGSPPMGIAAAPVTATPPAEPCLPEASQAAPAPMPAESDALAEQLLTELAPRLSVAMEKQVAAELRKNLDQTVANLLSQFDVNVREIVHDAVTEKLKQPRDPSS